MEERISRWRFIRLGTALGMGAAGASVLAACGAGGESGSGEAGGGGRSRNGSDGGGAGGGGGSKKSSDKKAGGSNGAQASGRQVIARASDVAPGSALKFRYAGQPAVLVHLKSGDFAAYSAVCTHQGCTVAYRNGLLACPCHGSVFDPANNGQVVSPPANRPLPDIPVEVRGGEVVRA